MKTSCFLMRLFAVLLLLGASVHAAPADSLLRQSAKFFAGSKGLSLDFEVNVRYAATGENGLQKGSLLVGERNRFRLLVTGMQFYSDGVNLWQYNPAQKQVMVKLLSDLESQFHPSEILFKYLNCKAKTVREEQWKGRAVHVLTLDPARYKGQFQAMEVWLDPKNMAPLRLQTVDNLGNLSWYTVSNLKRIANPSETDFVFVAPKGVDEIDMR